MGQQFSYKDNEERKTKGMRYDNPTNKYYERTQDVIGKKFYRPNHPIVSVDDLKHATFKSILHRFKGNLDYIYYRYDHLPIKHSFIVNLARYLYNCNKITKEHGDYEAICMVEKNGYFYYTNDIDNVLEKDKFDCVMIVLVPDLSKVDKIKEVLMTNVKCHTDDNKFTIKFPFYTKDVYKMKREQTKEEGKIVLISSSKAMQIEKLKEAAFNYFNFGEITYGQIEIITFLDGYAYKKKIDSIDPDDLAEYISITFTDANKYKLFINEISPSMRSINHTVMEPPAYVPTASAPKMVDVDF